MPTLAQRSWWQAGLAVGLLGTATAFAAPCPQPRSTPTAPAAQDAGSNPLPDTWRNRRAGRSLYHSRTGSAPSCATCHGPQGNGEGPLAGQLQPPPRNFRCAAQMGALGDGQLFWIIREGAAGTAMPAHPELSDEEVWLLVAHLRRLAR